MENVSPNGQVLQKHWKTYVQMAQGLPGTSQGPHGPSLHLLGSPRAIPNASQCPGTSENVSSNGHMRKTHRKITILEVAVLWLAVAPQVWPKGFSEAPSVALKLTVWIWIGFLLSLAHSRPLWLALAFSGSFSGFLWLTLWLSLAHSLAPAHSGSLLFTLAHSGSP